MPSTASMRSYVAGKFGLLLDGTFAGWIKRADTSAWGSHQVASPGGIEGPGVRKRLEFVPPSIALELGLGMTKPFYDWLSLSCHQTGPVKSCDILTANFNFEVMEQLSLTLAQITEVGFPACDASSKDPASMTIKLSSSAAKFVLGNRAQVIRGPVIEGHRRWLPSNFKLGIDGLGDVCSQVLKIDRITLRRAEPAVLRLTTLSKGGLAFVEWANSGNGARKGRLDFLTPDLQRSLFTLSFENLQVNKTAMDHRSIRVETVAREVIELRCGRVSLTATPS